MPRLNYAAESRVHVQARPTYAGDSALSSQRGMTNSSNDSNT